MKTLLLIVTLALQVVAVAQKPIDKCNPQQTGRDEVCPLWYAPSHPVIVRPKPVVRVILNAKYAEFTATF